MTKKSEKYTPSAKFEQELAQDHAQLAPEVDVCLAGNPALNGNCGESDCICCGDSNDDNCRLCGSPNNNGEGWDGLCGNCADRGEL